MHLVPIGFGFGINFVHIRNFFIATDVLLQKKPFVGVSCKHRVNLYYCALDPDGVLKDTRFILVQAECPNIQFVAAAHIISTERFIVWGTNRRERDRSQVSDGKVEQVLRARMLLSYVV